MRFGSSSLGSCLPGWWFIRYVFVFAMLIAVSAVLIAHEVNTLVAVWAPITSSAAAVAVLHKLRLLELPVHRHPDRCRPIL